MNRGQINHLLLLNDPAFWSQLKLLTERATEFDDLIFLSSLRKKAAARGLKRPGTKEPPLRLAILGGCTLYPLHELLTHMIETADLTCELFVGDYDNYVSEIMEADGALYQFRPHVVFLLPAAHRCKYPGAVTDARESAQCAAIAITGQLLELCRTLHERAGSNVLLGNFILPARHDVGKFRSRTLTSEWNFRKWVNLELGLNAPSFVHVCDLEFLANRNGALAAEDPRRWFESKQPCAPSFLVAVCREALHLILQLRTPPKKVLVLDLDNTLWGGEVAEDGLEGIEIGDTSPRGEAFKAFQKYISSLKERGILLAVCSKNEHARAIEPFEKHPEMVLRAGDFVSIKANWEPKCDNLWRIAAELHLGIESFVFVDDDPAEIEIVRQFAPTVSTILLSGDPADYVGELQDCRLFEPQSITGEDGNRTAQYRAERERQTLLASDSDIDAYLESLAMEMVIREFALVDVPRLAQLINKSNQFNLTTRRRTEAEVQTLIGRPDYLCFSARLRDRFGDYGLISIVIGSMRGDSLEIDTWLMSCRVLKRQVEETVLNELCRLARVKGCSRLEGVYLPTAKNEMVRDHYPRMGFEKRTATPEREEFVLELNSFRPRPTKITLRTTYESDGRHQHIADDFRRYVS
jgi:FkbH-like protein